jgi:hypothetical protein
VDVAGWLEELERRLARLRAEADAVMAMSAAAVWQSAQLVADSRKALEVLRELPASVGERVAQARPPHAGSPAPACGARRSTGAGMGSAV